jgi:hypothetical protein
MGIAVSKAAIALFLLRIVVRKWHIALLWSVMVSTSIFSIITTALLFLQCKPVSFLWNPTTPGGHCSVNFTDVGLSMGGKVSNIFLNTSQTNTAQPGPQPWTLSSQSFRGQWSWDST